MTVGGTGSVHAGLFCSKAATGPVSENTDVAGPTPRNAAAGPAGTTVGAQERDDDVLGAL